MADDWRVRECVNQLLLFFACEVKGLKAPQADGGMVCPTPLRPNRERIMKSWAVTLRQDIAKDHKNLKRLRGAADHEKNWVDIANEPPWSIGELVEWWIKAGLALAEWRAAGCEAGLLTYVGRLLLLDDDEEHPALWCADHASKWSLAEPDAAPMPPRWRDNVVLREDCIEALLDWCYDPRRIAGPPQGNSPKSPPMDDWARQQLDQYLDFGRSSLRLLRGGCRFGFTRDLPSSREPWRVYRGAGSPQRVCVLRRPLFRRTEADGRPVVTGWIMTPWPAALVGDFQRTIEARPPVPGCVARAIERARIWTAMDSTFGPLLPGSDDGAEIAAVDSDSTMTMASRLIALASLVVMSQLTAKATAVSEGDDPSILDLPDKIRWAAAFENLEFAWMPTPVDGATRLIPLGTGLGRPPIAGKTMLVVASAPGRGEAIVGAVGEPATCSDALLAVIEEVDWTCWALRTLHDAGIRTEGLSPVVAVTDEVGWEAVKRRMLNIESSPSAAHDTLSAAHRTMHLGRLRIERLAGGRAAALLSTTLSRLEAAICGMLASEDPAGVARLQPPRTPDGRVAMGAWLRSAGGDLAKAADWAITWERSAGPFGGHVRETIDAAGRLHILLSAGERASDADIRLLEAPGVLSGNLRSADEAVAAELRGLVGAAIDSGSPPDLGAGIDMIRKAFDGPHSAAFDRLVNAALAGDPDSFAWVRLMHADPRFGFACHPAITIDDAGIRVTDAVVTDVIEWRDDADVAVDSDIEIRFATTPARARRIVSRGLPAPGSREALAATAADLLRDGPAEVVAAAEALRNSIDRQRMFSTAAGDPVATAIALADVLARIGGDMGDMAIAAFRAITQWCAIAGITLVPPTWHPSQGVAAEGFATERYGFHPTVPPGCVVVERFGAADRDGAAIAHLEAFVSAGPAPAGYTDLHELVVALADDGNEIKRFRDCVREFPRRVHSGQVMVAAPVLFDVVWKAVMKEPERDDLRHAALAVHRLLDRSYNLIVFEPKTVGECMEGWMQTAEGGRPQGLRVERLLRPGLRTLDNKLKWPAIVETR